MNAFRIFLKKNKLEKWRKVKEGNEEHLSFMYGIANCLWKFDSIDTTKQAIDIAEQILKQLKGDKYKILEFLLDLNLQLSNYDKVEEIINSNKNKLEQDVMWIWTFSLIAFIKNYKNKEEIFLKAFQKKYDNLEILTGRHHISSLESKFLKNEAISYCNLYLQHWRFIDGAISWLRRFNISKKIFIKNEYHNETDFSKLSKEDMIKALKDSNVEILENDSSESLIKLLNETYKDIYKKNF